MGKGRFRVGFRVRSDLPLRSQSTAEHGCPASPRQELTSLRFRFFFFHFRVKRFVCFGLGFCCITQDSLRFSILLSYLPGTASVVMDHIHGPLSCFIKIFIWVERHWQIFLQFQVRLASLDM